MEIKIFNVAISLFNKITKFTIDVRDRSLKKGYAFSKKADNYENNYGTIELNLEADDKLDFIVDFSIDNSDIPEVGIDIELLKAKLNLLITEFTFLGIEDGKETLRKIAFNIPESFSSEKEASEYINMAAIEASRYFLHKYVSESGIVDFKSENYLKLYRQTSTIYQMNKSLKPIVENKFKIFPNNIDYKERAIILSEIFKDRLSTIYKLYFISKMSLTDIVNIQNNKMNSALDNAHSRYIDGELVPYVGHEEYIVGRCRFIRESINEFCGANEVPENIKMFFESALIVADSLLLGIDKILQSNDNSKEKYLKLEKKYYEFEKVEDTLSVHMDSIWNNYLSNPQDFNPENFVFIAHTLSDGDVEPDKMDKICATMVTNDVNRAPYGNYGYIYPYSYQNVVTSGYGDIGTWLCSKELLFEREFPNTWQYHKDSGRKGSKLFCEFEENSKLLLPSKMVEKLRGQRGYTEIFIQNDEPKIMPSGIFCLENQNSESYQKALLLSEKTGLPLLILPKRDIVIEDIIREKRQKGERLEYDEAKYLEALYKNIESENTLQQSTDEIKK